MVAIKDSCYFVSLAGQFRNMSMGMMILVAFMSSALERPAFADDSTEAAKTLKAMTAPNSSVTSLAYSSDGSLLAGGSFDGGVRVWDASTGKLLRNLTSHKSAVRGLAFAAEGTMLSSGSDDKTVILWDAHTGDILHKLSGLGGQIHSLALTTNGETVWFFSDKISAYNTNTGKKIAKIDADIDPRGFPRIDISPDEKTLVITSLEKEKRIAAHLYDIRTRRRIRSISEEGGGFLAVKFLPDNKHLAGSFFSPEDGKSVRVYDFEIGECQQVLRPTSDEFFAIDVSPDGKMLASGGNGPSIEEDTRLGRQTRRLSKFTIWDLDSGKAQLTNTGMLGSISSLSFSPDNKRIAYCDDATVTVIDIESGDPVWSGRYGFFPN
ncbi:WD domain, G-beta repeat [Symmachiella dynata]|uniref:WD40 repeat domain-containing protein n=1 Tax=Symmachiella dynata TaxID=2527995 RepID=UPI00118BDCD8|nr:PQQ-binding-like beta-propeller repeat protein [Symmachiella dynata]QDT48655.1 WD domain, G-beta repeat [Symmachiella dynata]